MRSRKKQRDAVRCREEAERLLKKERTLLTSERVNLDSLENSAANLQRAQGHLEQAKEHPEATPSRTIILTSAATAVSNAREHLEHIHQELEEAYRNEKRELGPLEIKSIILNAAEAAGKEVGDALEFLEEADGKRETPSIPREAREFSRNPAVRAIVLTTIAIAAVLAISEARWALALLGAICCIAAQQGIMVWTLMLVSTGNPGPARNRVDFHGILASAMTLALAACMTMMGAGFRLTLIVTTTTLLLVFVQWAGAIAMASQHHPDRQRQ